MALGTITSQKRRQGAAPSDEAPSSRVLMSTVAKTAITELAWDVNVDSHTNVVETAIKRLRAKLDGPFPSKLLHTVRGMGYVLEVREEAEPS